MRKKVIIHGDDVKKYAERKKNKGVTFSVENEEIYPLIVYVCKTASEEFYITANNMEICHDSGILFTYYHKKNGELRRQPVAFITNVVSVTSRHVNNLSEEMKKFEQGFAYKPPECKAALQPNQSSSSPSKVSDISRG